MPVKILKREYQSIFRPQDTGINWLLGNVGTWQRLTLDCQFSVRIDFTTTNALFMEEPNVFTLSDGSSWNEHGFEVGDNFVVRWVGRGNDTGVDIPYSVTGQITEINGSVMKSNNSTLGNGANLSNIYPTQLADRKFHSVSIEADKRPQGISFRYGHIENSQNQSQNLASFIDGTLTDFLAEDTHTMAPNQVKPFQFLGDQSGMSIASCDLTYLVRLGASYIYRIEVVFMLSSFFDSVTTFEDNVSPPQTFDAEGLTDNFKIIGFPKLNNPNVKIQNDLLLTAQLGNTGWFDENFNGQKNDFSVSSLIYRNTTGALVDGLDYQNPVKIEAIIEGVQNLNNQTRCSFGFAWVPLEDSDYKQRPDSFYKNVKMNTGGNASQFQDVFNVSTVLDPTLRNGYSSDGAAMNVRNVRFEQTGVNQITFEAEFVPDSNFTAFMEARDETERNYIVWVSVADQNEVTNESNRVSLLLDYNTLQTKPIEVGEWAGMVIDLLDHTQDRNSVALPCGNDIFIEDDLLARVTFQVDTNQGQPQPTSLTYGVIFENDTDGFVYNLDAYKIDLSQYPTPVQYSFSALRGFKLPSGGDKNVVEVSHYPLLDSGAKRGVFGLYGFRVRWEDWIERLNLPQEVRSAIYDNGEPQNGLNNDWYHYLKTAGWSIYFVVKIGSNNGPTPVEYINKKPLSFFDYNQGADVTASFAYYRQSDNTLLTAGVDPISGLPLGVILEDELVRLEVDFNRTSGTWNDINDIYGVSAIEVDGGAGQFDYRQLSSIWAPENGNPLSGVSAQTLDLQIISPTNIRLTCLIDPSLLIPASRYKITAREGCKN